MKTLRYTTLAALTTLAAAGASASGTHAGGHGHHSEDLIGKAGVAAKATRTVKVDMTDGMRFSPASIDVKQGETVRFVVTNSGNLKHELVLGTEKELKEHYEAMKKNPEMEHADANMVTLAPGKTGEVIWQFTKAGKVDFACLQPGHYEAGMKGAVNVAAQSGSGTVAPAAGAAPAAAAAELTEGEVRKVDKDSKKLTLKHGPLKNLDMPGMTMVFQVKEDTMLDKVQPGDKVRFLAEKIDGKFTVTKLEAER
jgi:uncharacterized cupredoxin-like copper-binding protein